MIFVVFILLLDAHLCRLYHLLIFYMNNCYLRSQVCFDICHKCKAAIDSQQYTVTKEYIV